MASRAKAAGSRLGCPGNISQRIGRIALFDSTIFQGASIKSVAPGPVTPFTHLCNIPDSLPSARARCNLQGCNLQEGTDHRPEPEPPPFPPPQAGEGRVGARGETE